MRKVSFRERLRYAFDNFMGKGTIALIGMLFLITAIVVVITGVLSTIGNGDASAGNSIWMSLMHALDAGTLAGDDTSNIGFVILMTIVTICGIFVTSILIGIISSAFEDKLNSLRKGFSRVVENNHTVIVGFNDSIYTILTELIEANSNHKKSCIIVIGQEEKEVMDEEIQNHIDDFKTTRIICRSGKATNSAILEMASVETARSVIINEENDFTVIKSILALVAYMKAKNVFENEAYITALIHNRENFDAARIAGEGKAEIIIDETRRELVHEDLGMVFAETLLPDFLTGYEYITFYMDLHNPDSEQTVDDYLDLFTFTEEERHRIIKGYSSGMKSKLAILCQFISRPKIIFLDEPLTAIDIIASAEIKDMLMELRKGRILILSTHMIQLAKDLCDDIVLLHNGKLRHFETALNREDFDESLLEALRGDGDVD